MTIRTSFSVILATALLGVSSQARADERKFELQGLLATTSLGELDSTDVGFGARWSYYPISSLALEGEVSFFPSDLPSELPVSSSRFEGLFGVKIGPRFEKFSVFGKVRPGFLEFAEAPAPFPCILIYPPPLSCVLGEGKTVFALDLGGGFEFLPTDRTVVRVDVSDLLLQYPGPALSLSQGAIPEGGFWSHNFRLSFGAGVRF